MRMWAWLRSLLLGEQEWCFESSDPPDAVVKRIKADIQDLGPIQRISFFSRGWRDLPRVDGIFGHVSAQRLQLVSDRMAAWPIWLAPLLIVLIPANLFLGGWGLLPARFCFDGRIEQRPYGCAISGSCRQEGLARYLVVFFVALGVAVLASIYAAVFLDPDIRFRILGNWGELDWPLKTVRLFVLAVPVLLFWILYRFMRLGTVFDLSRREELYQFIRRRTCPDPPR